MLLLLLPSSLLLGLTETKGIIVCVVIAGSGQLLQAKGKLSCYHCHDVCRWH